MNTTIKSSAFCTNVLASTIRAFSSIPLKMRSAVVSKHGENAVVQQTDVPVPKAGEVLVRIHRSGCCHTDIHVIQGDWPIVSRLPICPGSSTNDTFRYVSIIHMYSLTVNMLTISSLFSAFNFFKL
jgi:hypothetical protein